MPKRGNASPVAPAKRAKGRVEQQVCVVRWARCTDVDELDHKKINELDWVSGDYGEIHECIKEGLEEVVKDEDGTLGAFSSRESALQARDDLMKSKMREAKEAVRQNALSLSPAQWKELLKSDFACEYSDNRAFGEPSKSQDLAYRWAKGAFHKDAQHNQKDPLQVHYELAWGPLYEGCGVDVKDIETDDMVECCDTILTRIRCWVELVPLKD